MRKYLARRLEKPGILIFKEKHGTRYFICNTPEEFCRAAFHVLKDRLKEDYWYSDEDDEDRDEAAAEYAGMVRQKREVRKDKTLAKQIVKSKNYELAFEFMDSRSDWEYESMKIEFGEEYDR